MGRIEIGVVVLNWNGWRDTIQCLTALRKSSHKNFVVVAVDNGSADSSVEKIRNWAEGRIAAGSRQAVSRPRRQRVPLAILDWPCQLPEGEGRFPAGAGGTRPTYLLRSETNLGYAGGNNIGIEFVLGLGVEHVLLLNNDAFVAPDCLERMVEPARTPGGVHMVAAAVLEYDAPHKVDSMGLALTEIGVPFKRIEPARWPLFCPEGSCALYNGQALAALREVWGHYFDPDLFLYFDDVDLGWRLRALGFDARLAERARVFHKVGGSTRSFPSVPTYYGSRNALLFAFKHFSRRRWLRHGPWIAGLHLTDVFNKVGTPRFWPALKGKWAALSRARGARSAAGKLRRGALSDKNLPLTPNPFRLFGYVHWLPPQARSEAAPRSLMRPPAGK